MMLLKTFILFSLTPWVFGWQNQYTLVQENFTLEYSDRKVMVIEVGLYKFNETINAMNISFLPKITLPEDTKIAIMAYKWINNNYRQGFFEIRKTFKSVTEMEMFDIESLLIKYARPPIVWPLEKGVTYRSVGWCPDSTQFPPNTPRGWCSSSPFQNRQPIPYLALWRKLDCNFRTDCVPTENAQWTTSFGIISKTMLMFTLMAM